MYLGASGKVPNNVTFSSHRCKQHFPKQTNTATKNNTILFMLPFIIGSLLIVAMSSSRNRRTFYSQATAGSFDDLLQPIPSPPPSPSPSSNANLSLPSIFNPPRPRRNPLPRPSDFTPIPASNPGQIYQPFGPASFPDMMMDDDDEMDIDISDGSGVDKETTHSDSFEETWDRWIEGVPENYRRRFVVCFGVSILFWDGGTYVWTL